MLKGKKSKLENYSICLCMHQRYIYIFFFLNFEDFKAVARIAHFRIRLNFSITMFLIYILKKQKVSHTKVSLNFIMKLDS